VNQPSLEQDKLAQLEALAELAKAGVEKIYSFNQSSQKIAEKWQNIAKSKAVS